MRVFEPLRVGSSGAEVRLLQRSLPAWAWAEPLSTTEIDGLFGTRTEAAVKFFQGEHGIEQDGIAGPTTCSLLGIWADVIEGADVSVYQGDIDWPSVTGIGFVYIKATEGTTFDDPKYLANYQGARARGLLVGAYHFARGAKTPHEELDHCLSVVTSPLDLPLALDVEGQFALTGEAGLAWVLAWLEEAERRTSRRPIIYTSSRIVREKLGSGKGLERYLVWYPRWDGQPKNVLPWQDWSIWQYSSTGAVPGIPNPVDLNRLVTGDF